MTEGFLKETVILVVGDQSHDGHSRTCDIHIKCNKDAYTLRTAYANGVRISGVDLTRDIANNYEDSLFPDDEVEKLKIHGFDREKFLNPMDEKDLDGKWYIMEPEVFAEVWMFIAKIGEPDIKWQIISPSRRIWIGGYGLFST